MRIWLRPDRMASLGITASDVASAIREQNVQVPAGQVGQPVERHLRHHLHPLDHHLLHHIAGGWSIEGERLRDFAGLFEPGMHKSTLIGIFLAILELVSHHQVRVEQNELFGEIWLLLRHDALEPLDLSKVDNYDH